MTKSGTAAAPEAISIDPPFLVPRPVLRQSWLDLSFLHWSFPPESVRPLVPAELDLDLWEGKCYVGLVPFILADITYIHAPAVPWLSRFPETNVRTYVRDRNGHRGVWFFSLDAARLPAVVGARVSYALPYFWARMSVRREANETTYRSVRRFGSRARANMAVRSGHALTAPDERLAFLTARWRVFAYRGGRLFRADVDHPRWPLHQATVRDLDESVIRAAGLPAPTGEPLVQYSPGVAVRMGWPSPV